MEKKQNDSTIGKKIRLLRTQSAMTQDDLARELNVTRQALSNWERDINEPDLNTLQKICLVFGVQMDDLAREAMHMKKTNEMRADKKPFSKYDLAIGLFYAAGLFFGIGIFFTVGLTVMTPMGWAAALFAGGCGFLVFGLLCHAVITLKRKDRQ